MSHNKSPKNPRELLRELRSKLTACMRLIRAVDSLLNSLYSGENIDKALARLVWARDELDIKTNGLKLENQPTPLRYKSVERLAQGLGRGRGWFDKSEWKERH